jgi:hypothetical protein
MTDQSRECWRQLEEEWSGVYGRWSDEMAQYFQTHFWEPLDRETRSYHRALDALDEILQAAHAACKD